MILTMKKCRRCNEIKPLDQFNKGKLYKDKLKAWCVPCCSKWNKANTSPEKVRTYNLKSKYNLTIEQYEAMLAVQNNTCKICKKPEWVTDRFGQVKRLAVDHCHTTGKVRGLLCECCNKALGLFQDNPDLMLKGAQYVQENS